MAVISWNACHNCKFCFQLLILRFIFLNSLRVHEQSWLCVELQFHHNVLGEGRWLWRADWINFGRKLSCHVLRYPSSIFLNIYCLNLQAGWLCSETSVISHVQDHYFHLNSHISLENIFILSHFEGLASPFDLFADSANQFLPWRVCTPFS